MGINETSFLSLKSDLETIVADITNSSVYYVTSSFVEMLSNISASNVSNHSSANNSYERRKRSNRNGALINVVVAPTDTEHEKNVLGRLNDTFFFHAEMNSRLQINNTSTVSLIGISQIQRIPGNLVQNKLE